MAYDERLGARVRNALSDVGDLREQKTMGALCFMVADHICCGVTGDALTRPSSSRARGVAPSNPRCPDR